MNNFRQMEASSYALNKILERPVLPLTGGYYCSHIFNRHDSVITCKVMFGSKTSSTKATDYFDSLPLHFFTFDFDLNELEAEGLVEFDLIMPSHTLPTRILEKRYRDVLETAYVLGVERLYGITVSDPELEGVQY